MQTACRSSDKILSRFFPTIVSAVNHPKVVGRSLAGRLMARTRCISEHWQCGQNRFFGSWMHWCSGLLASRFNRSISVSSSLASGTIAPSSASSPSSTSSASSLSRAGQALSPTSPVLDSHIGSSKTSSICGVESSIARWAMSYS